jgi:gas vesicle protein
MARRAEDCGTTGSTGLVAMAFLSGALVGAATALLLAPEPGKTLRRRLAHGAKAAQEELSDVAAETREAVGALTKDARQTLRQTASRLSAALGATRDAITSDVEAMTKEPPIRASVSAPVRRISNRQS